MASFIEINNDYSFIKTQNTQILDFLYQNLRFRKKNYFHDYRYRMKKWDGFINFFNKENGKFLSGLLPEVLSVLIKFKEQYTIKNNKTDLDFAVKSIDKDFLKDINPQRELYDYQVEYVNQIIKHKRGVIFSPTSSGKSLMMVCTIKALQTGTPVLLLQNRVDLAEQNYDELIKWGVKNVGSIWGGSFNPNVVTVANIASIGKIETLIPKFKVLIVDEIHDMMSKVPISVYKKMKSACVRIGVSATPFKDGGKDYVQKFQVKGFFGPVLTINVLNKETNEMEKKVLTTKELQDRNILSKSNCTFHPIDYPDLQYDTYQDAVTRGIAENYYFHQIVERLAKKQVGRTLILVERIAQGDTIHGLIKGSLWIAGKDNKKTRKEVINQLTNAQGNIVAIATRHIFNTGINMFVHNLINAAGGYGEHMIVQRMGRGLRVCEDKEMLDYHDFLFLNNSSLKKHSKKRISVLEKEGHKLIIKSEIDF